MTYKLIAFDIDGTIRSNEYPISERTRTAIERVQASGAAVTLATGRMFISALESTDGLNITCPIVSFQGAHVAVPATGEVLWHRPLTTAMALAVLKAMESWKGEVLAYYGSDVYVDRQSEWVEAYAARNKGRVHVVDDLRPLASRGLTRLAAVCEGDSADEFQERLTSVLETPLYVTRSLPHFCEILHPETGKDKALAWLGAHLGIRREDTVAFGNGYEDSGMLRWAGLGVAVADGDPKAIQAADRVAPAVEEDGAAQVLEELLAEGLLG